MATSSSKLASLSLIFESLFSKRVWQSAQVLLAGAILCVGTRTVASCLRVMGLAGFSRFQRFHRVLSRAEWSSLHASRRLLQALVEAFAPEGPLVMALDDTIERRRGLKIAARGVYRDAVASSDKTVVKVSGLRWLCLMLVAPIPWAGRLWALPFFSVLVPSEPYYVDQRRSARKLTDRARQMVRLAKRWLPDREIVVTADSSFSSLKLLHAARRRVTFVTRLKLNAGLYEPPPPRLPGTVGRPRLIGARQPKLCDVLIDPKTVWESLTMSKWYGTGERRIEVVTGTALWYHGGKPIVPLRWVLVRDPLHELDPQAFLCTNQNTTPAQILGWFVQRWQIEVTFEEARAHLGMETQRQWSDKAIERSTPIVLALYSMVALLAKELIEKQQQPMLIRQAAWYRKDCATFSDTIALVRRHLWCSEDLWIPGKPPDTIKIPRALFDCLIDTLAYAA
jgi:hypothetical protein